MFKVGYSFCLKILISSGTEQGPTKVSNRTFIVSFNTNYWASSQIKSSFASNLAASNFSSRIGPKRDRASLKGLSVEFCEARWNIIYINHYEKKKYKVWRVSAGQRRIPNELVVHVGFHRSVLVEKSSNSYKNLEISFKLFFLSRIASMSPLDRYYRNWVWILGGICWNSTDWLTWWFVEETNYRGGAKFSYIYNIYIIFR